MPRRRQDGLWPLRAVVWADEPLPSACIGGQRESSLLVQYSGERDNNFPGHVGKMRAQQWSQFFAERKHFSKSIWAKQSLFFPEKDLPCDPLLCTARL